MAKPLRHAVFSHTLTHRSFLPLSAFLLCSAGGLALGALRGDLGLVNTSIINLNRNEPGRLLEVSPLRGQQNRCKSHGVRSPPRHSVNLSQHYIFPPALLTVASLRCTLSVLHVGSVNRCVSNNYSDGMHRFTDEESQSHSVCW